MLQDPLGPYGLLLWPPLLLCAAAALRLLLPQQWHLQWLFKGWADALRHKTLHSRRPKQQQLLAGSLGLVLLLLPMLAFAFSAMLHPLLELLLLTLLLPVTQLPGKALMAPLQRNDKATVVTALTPFAIRDLSPLSPLGLTKAAIELQLERRTSQFFSVSFWYLIGGLPLAASSWLLAELSRHWHIDRPQLHAFGYVTHLINAVLQLPAQLLLGLTLSLYGSPKRPWQLRQQLSQQWDRRYQHWLQLCFACSLGIQLSGPWLLEGQKVARPRLGPEVAAQPGQLQRAVSMLNMAQTLWLLVPLLGALAFSWIWHQAS